MAVSARDIHISLEREKLPINTAPRINTHVNSQVCMGVLLTYKYYCSRQTDHCVQSSMFLSVSQISLL